MGFVMVEFETSGHMRYRGRELKCTERCQKHSQVELDFYHSPLITHV